MSVRRRNDILDLNRILACLGVIGFHTLFSINRLYFACTACIPLFWMCSGYALTIRGNVDYPYVFRKISRILRVVVLWDLIAYAVVKGGKLLILHHADFPHGAVDPLFAIAGSLLQKSYFWNFWYFGAMMLVYLLAPLLLQKCSPRGRLILWAALAVLCTAFQWTSYGLETSLQARLPQTLRLWTWLQYFLLGSVLADRLPGAKSCQKGQTLLSTFITLLLWLGSVLWIAHQIYVLHDEHAEYYYDDPVILVFAAVLFAVLMKLRLPEQLRRVVKAVVPLTMGVYMIQPLILKLLVDRTPLHPVLVFLLVAGICFGLVWILRKSRAGRFLTSL